VFANLLRSFARRSSRGLARLRVSTAVGPKDEGAVKAMFGYERAFSKNLFFEL
jgi:hypothetical protein